LDVEVTALTVAALRDRGRNVELPADLRQWIDER
jgi:hypothetical protein